MNALGAFLKILRTCCLADAASTVATPSCALELCRAIHGASIGPVMLPAIPPSETGLLKEMHDLLFTTPAPNTDDCTLDFRREWDRVLGRRAPARNSEARFTTALLCAGLRLLVLHRDLFADLWQPLVLAACGLPVAEWQRGSSPLMLSKYCLSWMREREGRGARDLVLAMLATAMSPCTAGLGVWYSHFATAGSSPVSSVRYACRCRLSHTPCLQVSQQIKCSLRYRVSTEAIDRIPVSQLAMLYHTMRIATIVQADAGELWNLLGFPIPCGFTNVPLQGHQARAEVVHPADTECSRAALCFANSDLILKQWPEAPTPVSGTSTTSAHVLLKPRDVSFVMAECIRQSFQHGADAQFVEVDEVLRSSPNFVPLFPGISTTVLKLMSGIAVVQGRASSVGRDADTWVSPLVGFSMNCSLKTSSCFVFVAVAYWLCRLVSGK